VDGGRYQTPVLSLTYLLTYLRSWALPEKLPIVQPFRKFPEILRNPEVHHRVQKAFHLPLSWANEISEIVKRHLSQIFLVNALNKNTTHYRWPTDHFALHRECLFSRLWTFYTTALQFFTFRPQTAAHNSRWTSAALVFLARSTWTTARIFQLAGLSIAGHITHFVEPRTNTRWPVMWWFTKLWFMWCYLACATCPLPPLLHWLPKINKNCSPNSPRISHLHPNFPSSLLSSGSPTKTYIHYSSLPYLLHALPMSSYLTWSF
jgi:hypothetical protein